VGKGTGAGKENPETITPMSFNASIAGEDKKGLEGNSRAHGATVDTELKGFPPILHGDKMWEDGKVGPTSKYHGTGEGRSRPNEAGDDDTGLAKREDGEKGESGEAFYLFCNGL